MYSPAVGCRSVPCRGTPRIRGGAARAAARTATTRTVAEGPAALGIIGVHNKRRRAATYQENSDGIGQ